MKKNTFLNFLIILILSISYSVHSQCPNLNFNMGNFTNWQGYLGSCGSGIYINPSAITPGRHTIMDAAQLLRAGQLYDEQCMKIKKVPDGFAYAAKLGNESTGAEMEAIEYTMTVGSDNSLLLLHFAWIMENVDHSLEEQPRFTLTIRDSVGNPIPNSVLPCAFHDFVASSDMEGLACYGSVIARDWTTVGYSLEHLMGRTIKIYFETRDCTLSGHFGYAYVVVECRKMTLDLMYCEGQNAARFRAPDGFKKYTWTRSVGKPSLIRSGEGRAHQNITLTDAYDGEIITCEVESALAPECSATLNTVVKKTAIDAKFSYGVMEYGEVDFIAHNNQNWYDTCSRTVTFVDRSTVANSKLNSRSWLIHGLNMAIPRDSMVTITFPDPGLQGLDSVRYLVRLTVGAENGCADTSKVLTDHYITIYASPRVEIEGVTEMCQGNAETLQINTIRSQFVDYTWRGYDIDGGIYSSTDTFLIISKPGTYYIEAMNIDGCIVRDTHIVTSLLADLNILEIQGPSCFGGNDGYFTHGAITGGQAPYQSFTWTLLDSNGNTYIDPIGNINGNTYMNLVAGTYTFEAVDFAGCILKAEIEIIQPELLEIYRNRYITKDEDVFIYAIGGTAPYNYTIAKNDGSFSVQSDSATGLSDGSYIISVTDANGCKSIDSVIIVMKNDTMPTYISGAITALYHSDIVSGKIYLYLADMNSMRYLLVDSVLIQPNGTYVFTPVADGNYLLKAVADNIFNAIPTYYGNTDNWSLATTIAVHNNSYWWSKDIEIVVLEPLIGNSQISGYVGEDGTGTKSIHKSGVENPCEGVTVLLKRKDIIGGYEVVLTTISRTQTDNDGYFEFENIPIGNYIVVLDILGLGMIDYHEVEITEDGQIVEDLNYTVTEDGIETDGSTDIRQLSSDATLNIYPNPVQNSFYIQSSLVVEQVSIYDISGRMLKQICNPRQEIQIGDLANGIYLVKVKTVVGEMMRKIVKQ